MHDLMYRLLPGVLAICACSTKPPSSSNGDTIDQLSWLAGCWEAQSATQVTEEQWMEPRGKSMLGMNRVLRNGELAGYELVVIREDSGRLVFRAHPSGQPSAAFEQLTLSDTQVVFANPEHDYPQRIGYSRRGADSLSAWIWGVSDGDERRIDFQYQRTACVRR
jgi:hypothetical protein